MIRIEITIQERAGKVEVVSFGSLPHVAMDVTVLSDGKRTEAELGAATHVVRNVRAFLAAGEQATPKKADG